jgi:hypothetical protein
MPVSTYINEAGVDVVRATNSRCLQVDSVVVVWVVTLIIVLEGRAYAFHHHTELTGKSVGYSVLEFVGIIIGICKLSDIYLELT